LSGNTSCLIEQVVVVSGETGCGKTTQLPQYILESEIDAARGASCNIICTQPRRISAIAISERVAAERGEKIGESVSRLYLSRTSFIGEQFCIALGNLGYFILRMLSECPKDRDSYNCPFIG
jgi:hypothetical protein